MIKEGYEVCIFVEINYSSSCGVHGIGEMFSSGGGFDGRLLYRPFSDSCTCAVLLLEGILEIAWSTSHGYLVLNGKTRVGWWMVGQIGEGRLSLVLPSPSELTV